jgi:transposase
VSISKVDVTETLKNAKQLLETEKDLSPAIKAMMKVLLMLVSVMADRLSLNSSNSSIPPSQDLNREKKKKANRSKKKPGGQKGHKGTTLKKIANPDRIEVIKIDRRTLPKGKYSNVGYESRQVFDIKIEREVTEYRAEILVDENGMEYKAEFPEGIVKAAQYGNDVKSQSVYMSQFQLIPLDRTKDYFEDQIGLPISKGSIVNFNREAYVILEGFEAWAKEQLLKAPLDHADETGINVNGKQVWLHCLSNQFVTLCHADKKRGKAAMDKMGILPEFCGKLCHDHWKPYYRYDKCTHCLCNAHHLRELERAWEHDGQNWARSMKRLLLKINKAVDKAGGVLSKKNIARYEKKYRAIIKLGEQECPLALKEKGKRGKQKQSKSRNLLTRLRDFEADTLLFMKDKDVPFTNNQVENDLRMTKVQQKISGCFRSMYGAKMFCRIRSFLSTCRKNGVSPTDALRDLFQGNMPAFMNLP